MNLNRAVNQNDLQRVIAEVLAAEPVTGGAIDPWRAAEEVIDAFRYIGWIVVPNPDDRRPATPDEFLGMLSDVRADGGMQQ